MVHSDRRRRHGRVLELNLTFDLGGTGRSRGRLPGVETSAKLLESPPRAQAGAESQEEHIDRGAKPLTIRVADCATDDDKRRGPDERPLTCAALTAVAVVFQDLRTLVRSPEDLPRPQPRR